MANGNAKKQPTPKIVDVPCEPQSISKGAFTTFTVRYSESGYRCYPILVKEYRTRFFWGIVIKQTGDGLIVFDYYNNTDINLSSVTPIVDFLCIPY